MKFKMLGLSGRLMVNSSLKMCKIRLKRYIMIYTTFFYAHLFRMIQISLLDWNIRKENFFILEANKSKPGWHWFSGVSWKGNLTASIPGCPRWCWRAKLSYKKTLEKETFTELWNKAKDKDWKTDLKHNVVSRSLSNCAEELTSLYGYIDIGAILTQK